MLSPAPPEPSDPTSQAGTGDAEVLGTGAAWEMGQSWTHPALPCQQDTGWWNALVFPRRPCSIGCRGWSEPSLAPSCGTHTRHRPHMSPACPCHAAAPGSRSLLLVSFRAVPLSPPSARPIYSLGLFLGQACVRRRCPGAHRGMARAVAAALHTPHPAWLPVPPHQCWSKGLCRAPGEISVTDQLGCGRAL